MINQREKALGWKSKIYRNGNKRVPLHKGHLNFLIRLGMIDPKKIETVPTPRKLCVDLFIIRKIIPLVPGILASQFLCFCQGLCGGDRGSHLKSQQAIYRFRIKYRALRARVYLDRRRCRPSLCRFRQVRMLRFVYFMITCILARTYTLSHRCLGPWLQSQTQIFCVQGLGESRT